ncbi:Uncharacterized conserved protein [Marinactinospora thermotolerans DSM 45154]|uniref:Uncharacterized conserved protein n=1 Tax=Marinactinospora thermotolerans DSM 45154 TaxID=1122192 RepID=A0A1T4S0N6_9ACTN|nr:Uncharacterized conserved protein [Marinactinospora thermotolerans DSM 45154]
MELAPFQGLRYATADARALIDSPTLDLALALAPPYDVVDAQTATDLVRGDPHNAVRLTLPPAAREAGDPPWELCGPDRYQRAALTLRRWVAEGVLVRDPTPALYVYEQTSPTGHRQRGLIGALRLPPPDSPVVRPHEAVLAGPVADRARLMAATRANLEPIFLLYQGGNPVRGAATLTVDAIAQSSTEALVDTVTGDGVTHRLWAISDTATLRAVATDLAARTALIADGHHRYAAYQRLRAERDGPGPWDHGLAFLVDSDAWPPRLGAIHRVLPKVEAGWAARTAREVAVVEELSGGDLRSALARLRDAAGRGPALLLADSGTCFLLHGFDRDRLRAAMPDRSHQWRRLPTSVLERVLLPLWGVADTSVRLVHDEADGALAAARPDGSAVILPPLEVSDVYAVTARGELTPRKSTSFGPKPRTGLVLRAFP